MPNTCVKSCVIAKPSRLAFALACSLFLLVCTTNSLVASNDNVASSELVSELVDTIKQLNERIENLEKRLSYINTVPNKPQSIIPGDRSPALDFARDDAWRRYRWTDPKQWKKITNGVSEDEVISALGAPPRWVKSMKPGEDKVFYYEIGGRYIRNKVKGYVAFKKGIVVDYQEPNFTNLNSQSSRADG